VVNDFVWRYVSTNYMAGFRVFTGSHELVHHVMLRNIVKRRASGESEAQWELIQEEKALRSGGNKKGITFWARGLGRR